MAAKNDLKSTEKAKSNPASAKTKSVNLALQGGGSHGAFTWGVLDALIEDGRISFEGITGASAGAMNAAVVVDGMLDRPNDPREGAREALYDFWRAVSRKPGFASVGAIGGALGGMLPNASMFNLPGFAPPNYALDHNPAFVAFDILSRVASPYQLNPLNLNPLRDVLEAWIDFDRLRSASPLKLFVCATNVRTGRPHVFRESELTCDMLLASACLPFFFQAPEIDGEFYWDGAYSGNPPLFPLHAETTTRDIVLVAINPLVRPHVPGTATEIIDRASEISFNSSLMLEMRTLEFVLRLLDREMLDKKRYKRVLMHMISGEDTLREFGASSKFNTSWDFLVKLRDLGRSTAKAWLDANAEHIGRKPTVDIAKTFL